MDEKEVANLGENLLNRRETREKALSKSEEELSKIDQRRDPQAYAECQEEIRRRKEELESIASKNHIDEIIPVINIDAKIDLSDIGREMVNSLKQLEPFGEANKMPIFAFKNLKIDSIRALSEGKHLKLTLKDNNNIINAIGFNMGNLVEEYKMGDKVDVAGVLEINTFNGVDNIQINMKDIMKSI